MRLVFSRGCCFTTLSYQATTTPVHAFRRLQTRDLRGPQPNRSQFATGSQKHATPIDLPYALTEHGALMAANILNTPRAVAMSIMPPATSGKRSASARKFKASRTRPAPET
jgi:hypothetical protein